MNKYFGKNIMLVALLVLLLSAPALSQRGKGQWQERHEQLEAQRIAYITRELSLSPAEAQAFWPVYNQYNKKRNEMMMRHRQQRRQNPNLDQLSEAELLEIADKDIQNMEEMTRLRREYHEKFKEILPIKKVVQLYFAERDFNRWLMRQSRGQQRERGRGRE